jgi:hypothetical protein
MTRPGLGLTSKRQSRLTTLEARMRRRRARVLGEFLGSFEPPVRVLDLGGEWPFWRASGLADRPLRITLLNTSRSHVSLPSNARAVLGSALDFADELDPAEFDVVVSNSVIGHVGGWNDQRRMADQITNFGRPFYLQTPNHWFFLDWRTLLPGFHWLPPRVQASILCRVRCGRWPRSPSREHALERCLAVRNLTRAELSYLFPHARIDAERFGWFVKSWMLVGGIERDAGLTA